MMQKLLSIALISIAATALSTGAIAKNPSKRPATANRTTEPTGTPYARRADAMRFADDLAERRDLDREWVRQAIGQARFLAQVPRLVLPPAKGTAKNWQAYRSRFIEPVRIRAGVRFWHDHGAALARAEREYGVPAEIIVGIMTFLFGAAYDTCQNALTWALVLLTQHPEIADRLATEIDDAFGGDLPTAARLAALPLLDGVTREAMRLMPPVPLQFRKSLAPTTLGGCDIETGTRVLVSAHLINRNPAIYPDPDRFVPDRWPGLNPSPFDYPVFGAGAHMCPGVTFGYQMMKIALATIVAHHKVELSPSARVGYRTAITLTATGRVGIVLRPRRGAHRGPALVGKFRQIVALP